MSEQYDKRYLDPRWQKLRLRVFERDCWACCTCNDKASPLHIHHLLYFSGFTPWEYPPFFLITLCETCHEDKLLPPHALWTAMLGYKLESLERCLERKFDKKCSLQLDCVRFLLEVV